MVSDSIWIAGNLALVLPDRPVWRSVDAPELTGAVLWVARQGTAQALAATRGKTAAPAGGHSLRRGGRREAVDLAFSP